MPYPLPVACLSLSGIAGIDCIGDTRTFINDNFTRIGQELCNLFSNVITLSTTSTVEHTFDNSTRELASDVRNNSIDTIHLADEAVTTAKLSDEAVTTDKIAPDTVRYSQLASWQTLSASPTLSAEAVQPRLAKAWINFNGTGTPSIQQSFNVSSLIDNGTGLFTIVFRTPMLSSGYCVVGTANGVAFVSFPVTLQTSLSVDRVAIASGSEHIGAYDSPEYKLVVFSY